MKLFQEQFMKKCNNNKSRNFQSLYLMSDGNLYKIGISNKPEKRLKQFKTGNPKIYLICYSEPISFAYDLEHNLHKLFHNNNVNGEWFKIKDENSLKNLMKLINNVSENSINILEMFKRDS